MKDSVMQQVKPSDIVVVKPSARNSRMRVGFVISVSPSGKTARVVSMDCKAWYRKEKEYERVEGNFMPNSVFMIREGHDILNDHQFPAGFPEELKKEFFKLFAVRKSDKTDTV